MKAFFRYLLGTVFLPGRAFSRLSTDPRRARRGVQAVLFTAGLYTVVAAALAVAGAVPMAPIFLPLRPENYYFWEMLFALPVVGSVWLAGSALIHFPGRRRESSLRTTLAVFGFAMAGPFILAWLPLASAAVFYGLGMGQAEMVEILSIPSIPQTLFLGIYGLAAAWSLALVIRAAAVSRKTGPARALLLALPAEAVLLAAAALFLR